MKSSIKIGVLIMLCVPFISISQEKGEHKSKQEYYAERAKQDATYEQEFASANEDDEEDFWEDQEQYEKDLKKRDKKAYKAYMKGKRDAYAEHHEHCSSHCHHSDHYYHHATFYYYGYNEPRRNYRRATISTGVRINTPSVRVGLF